MAAQTLTDAIATNRGILTAARRPDADVLLSNGVRVVHSIEPNGSQLALVAGRDGGGFTNAEMAEYDAIRADRAKARGAHVVYGRHITVDAEEAATCPNSCCIDGVLTTGAPCPTCRGSGVAG